MDLTKLGLTKGESQVYLALIKIGNTTSGEIISRSGISRSKVYEVLEKLKVKGLVTEMIKNNTKYFEATSPNKILDYIKTKKDEIESMEDDAKKAISDLIDLQRGHLENQEARVYVSFEGWKTLYNEILDNLKSGDEYLAFGIGPEEFRDEKVQIFFKNFHLKRAEKRIIARIIMRPETKNIMDKDFSKLKFYHYRFSNINFPTNINIHNDNVVILVWGASPVAFMIHSKQVADKYRAYFEEVWKSAKKR